MKRVYECMLICSSPSLSKELSSEALKHHLVLKSMLCSDFQGTPQTLQSYAELSARYDAVVFVVGFDDLQMMRILMNDLRDILVRPMIVWGLDIQWVALQDMWRYGAVDFVSGRNACVELYTRIAYRQGCLSLHNAYQSKQDVTESVLSESCSEGYQLGIPIDINRSFQEFKEEVLAYYERQYLASQLKRYEGNITLAAKASKKHRRSFWEVMRRRGLVAGEFRPH